MIRRLTFFYAIYFACTITNAYCQQKERLTEWLTVNSVKMSDSTYGIENYKQLDKYLSGKLIIGAGEATHGTAEFQIIKYNLFKYLVLNQGFRTLALEVPHESVNLLNEYILYGKGGSAEAVKAMGYWTYHTRDTEELVKWIRTFNQSATESDKIKVYGIDLSSSINTQFLKDSLLRTSLFTETGLDSLKLISITANKLGPVDTALWTQLDELARNILLTLRNNKNELTRYVSDFYYQSLELNLISLQQLSALKLIPRKGRSDSYRDSCMAANTVWLANSQPNNKVFLGAHNGHIQNADYESNYNATGYYLKKLVDTAYYSIGFQFAGGNFAAIKYDPSKKRFSGMSTFNVDSEKKGSFGNYFSHPDFGNFFLDINSLVDRKFVHDIFYQDVNLRMVGCCYDERIERHYFQKGIVSELYDGLFFIQNTHRANLFK